MKKISLIICLIFISLCMSGCKTNNANNDDMKSVTETPETENVYVNLEYGYQLTFPESWQGWYEVDDTESGKLRIKFVGKSKTGSVAAEEYFGGGLPMFFIVPESDVNNGEMLDSVREIGEARNVKYYYATGTGSDLGALVSIADESSAVRQIADYEVDEEELRLAAEDWEKVQEMLEDVDEILLSFKEIE